MTPQLHAYEKISATERIFLAAEQEPDKESALKKWKMLLEDLKGNPEDLPTYITADKVQHIIIDLYVQLYANTASPGKAAQAYEYINQIPDKEIRLWGLVHFLYQITKRDDLKSGSDLYAIAQDSIDSIYFDAMELPTDTQERLYYALTTIMTSEAGQRTYQEKEMQRVHDLIVRIKHPKHRLELMQRFGALSKSFTPSLYPSTFHHLYLAFAEAQPDDQTLAAIHAEAVSQDHFHAALYALLGITEEKTRTAKLKEYFQTLMEQGAVSRARRVAEQTDNRYACVSMWSGLLREYLYYGYDLKAKGAHERATACAEALEEKESRTEALKLIQERQADGEKKHAAYTEPDPKKKQELLGQVDKMLEEKGIAQAAALVKEQSDTKLRVSAFHHLAKQQAAKLDRYTLLKNETPYKNLTDPVSYFLTQEGDKASPELIDVKAQEEKLLGRYGRDASNVMVYEGEPSNIGQAIHYNAMPQQTNISGEAVRAKLPLPHNGHVILSHYESNIFNSSFIRLFGNSGFVLSQQSSAPLVITIENGVVDPSTIYDELVDLGSGRCMEKTGNIYTLHCPLIVGTNATLVMSGDDLSEIRLSTQSGSYILNANIIYMTDISLVGWDSDNRRPMWLDYEKRDYFRPFFTSWNRSYTYIANSEITALGYDNGKSYGISFSSGPNNWEKLGEIDNNERPTGIIVNNSFRNMMFGFYSFEAYNAVVVGNEYVNNVVYGIDPHDRSTHLVVAYNTVYGSAKKHGIIISREVGKSLIAGNVSFKNHGSGIMLDRESDETLIYGNTAFANNQEGITLFESNCNIIAANMLFENKGSGIRVRNSYDVGLYYNQIDNNNHGITAYTLALEEDPIHSLRNFVLDPYTNITTFAAVGNLIKANKTGIYVEDIDGMFLKQNSFIKQAPSLYRGDWFATRMPDIMQMDQQLKGAAVSRICPTTQAMPRQHSCMFRQNATLYGDGLDLLMTRLSLPLCTIAQATLRTAKKEATP